MLDLVRVNQDDLVLEAYTDRAVESLGVCLPEFRVKFKESSTPKYAILSRNNDYSYDNLTGFDTLNECVDYITQLTNSRS